MVEVASLKAKNEELIQRLHKSEEQHVVCKEQLARALTRLSQVMIYGRAFTHAHAMRCRGGLAETDEIAIHG